MSNQLFQRNTLYHHRQGAVGNDRTSPTVTELLCARLREKTVLKLHAVSAFNLYKYFSIAYATSSPASTHVCFSYSQIRRLFTHTHTHIFSSLCMDYCQIIDTDMSTAIGLTTGGSSTVHIYTQPIHRTTQITTEQHK
jgi:hypothetical protein